ncbi:hypothetical protein CQW23_05632 [Capsicum baccatum]|uniref:F-box associated domain-containing protein n=1 Tax=Capsicum baccatum TaxID=33114 RepID=A0A2G2XI30_CAPBA|nr:hypothetical protein CQW23_05632 [Capsicum baccatum]
MLHLRWNPDCHFWSSTLPLDEVFKDIQLYDCDRIIGAEIFCSCDGLFLIGIWFEPYVVQPSILVIWNPSTKESIAIPHSKCPLQMDGDDDGYYDGPNDMAGSVYGFAYDSTNDDYKVFRLTYDMFGEIQLPEIVCSQIHFKSVVDVDVGVSMLGGMLGVYYKNGKAFDLWTISGGPSDLFWPLDYVDDGAATIEWNDFVYTESLSPKLMDH